LSTLQRTSTYDFDDPLYGLADQTCLGDGNWGDCDYDSGS
jgi:hypothetical protein